jgi:hypothetical protein
MGGIDRERGEDRKHIRFVIRREMSPVLLGQPFFLRNQLDAMGSEGGNHVIDQAPAVLVLQNPDHGGDGPQLLFGRHAIGGTLAQPDGDLLLEARHANLEELIQVGGKNAEEFHPLEERGALVDRLVQHSAVELQPGQLAIDVERRVPQV